MTEARQFQVTGIDYKGALSVSDNNAIKKLYILLFTCAVTRAVHLELIHSMSEHDFLDAFVRFYLLDHTLKQFTATMLLSLYAHLNHLYKLARTAKVQKVLFDYRVD